MTASTPQAYIASPLGFSEAGRDFYNKIFLPLVEGTGFAVIDPWKLIPSSVIDPILALPYGPNRRLEWQTANQIIGKNNAEGIKRADIIVAVLDGVDVDSGTASEIGFGSALNKRIVGYRGDFRLSADNEGGLVNLQVEYFIQQSGGVTVASLEALVVVLTKWKKEYV